MERLRICISAYYFSPYRGSESAVGWKIATGLAKYHDVTVLCGDLNPDGTTGNHLREFEKVASYPEGLSVEYLLADKIAQTIHDWHSLPGCWFFYYTAYKRWQKNVYARVKEMHGEKPFDVVHHLNILGYREPGYLWRLDVPFVWGPVSGAPMIPLPFLSTLGTKGLIRHLFRNVMNWMQMRTATRSKLAARKAARVWVVSEDDRRMVEELWGSPSEFMLEVGAEKTAQTASRDFQRGQPLRLCWSGLLHSAKALPLLLQALGGLPAGADWELHVLGGGAESSVWRAMSEELGISDRVVWHGMLPRDEAVNAMSQCDVLVHTSLKEATGTVTMEALGLGLPVICHDACGMGVAIDDRCGIKIPLETPKTSIEGFKNAIELLLGNPDLLRKLSEGAVLRADELSWGKKVERIAQAYVEVSEGV